MRSEHARPGRVTGRAALSLAALAASLVAGACAPSSTPAPLAAECTVEVRNGSRATMEVTAFGRTKMPLGALRPGERTTFTELCRVERVSVRGVPSDGGEPIWVVAVMRAGHVVSVSLDV